jgi:hypothetical protein
MISGSVLSVKNRSQSPGLAGGRRNSEWAWWSKIGIAEKSRDIYLSSSLVIQLEKKAEKL